MKALVFSVLIVIFSVFQCMAGDKAITYFLDGAKVEYDTSFSNGALEIRLPKAVLTDSLRVKPLPGSNIDKVEMNRLPRGPRAEKEIQTLVERKNLLLDRLKALETREKIFTAAAKSQSGRAPRKTKNNPEPMTNIRKGTEFAIGQRGDPGPYAHAVLNYKADKGVGMTVFLSETAPDPTRIQGQTRPEKVRLRVARPRPGSDPGGGSARAGARPILYMEERRGARTLEPQGVGPSRTRA